MKRGDVVLVSGKGDYGKSRPAVVVQADYLAERLESITVCPFTSDILNVSIRIGIEASQSNGLRIPSEVWSTRCRHIRDRRYSVRLASWTGKT